MIDHVNGQEQNHFIKNPLQYSYFFYGNSIFITLMQTQNVCS